MFGWAFASYFLRAFLLYALCLRLFDWFCLFPLDFECLTCKTCFLEYNNKGICVKSMFISLVLDYNWWLEMAISDCQHTP
jgi:hypothetical protein